MNSERPLPAGRSRLPGIVLLLSLLGNAAIRWRLLSMPLERDEGEYAYAGQLILQGVPPYRELYNMKWPGTYYVYALFEALFGQTTNGVHFGLLLLNLVCIGLVYLIGRRLVGDWGAAAAAVCYAILSISPALLAFAGHATHFVVLAALAAWYVLLRADERARPGLYFLSGVFAGLAPLMKQPGVFFTAFIGLAWVGNVLERRRSETTPAQLRLRWFVSGPALASGVLAPFLLLLISLWITHTFQSFRLWTIDYARYYGTHWPWIVLPQVFVRCFANAVEDGFAFWIVAALGLCGLPFFRRRIPRWHLLIALTVLSFAAVCPGLLFREHYFILMLPAVALLVGAAVAQILPVVDPRRANLPGADRPAPNVAMSNAAMGNGFTSNGAAAIDADGNSPVVWLRRCAAIAVVALPLGIDLLLAGSFYFEWSPDEACRRRYWGNPFVEAVNVADYLAKRTSPQDRIAILGSEPEIFFYARRRSATGFIYTYSLMEEQPYAHQFQEQMIREIEAARPKYVVYVNCAFSWLPHVRSDLTLFKWFEQYRPANLKLVGVAETNSQMQASYDWNSPSAAGHTNTISLIAVYKRVSDHE